MILSGEILLNTLANRKLIKQSCTWNAVKNHYAIDVHRFHVSHRGDPGVASRRQRRRHCCSLDRSSIWRDEEMQEVEPDYRRRHNTCWALIPFSLVYGCWLNQLQLQRGADEPKSFLGRKVYITCLRFMQVTTNITFTSNPSVVSSAPLPIHPAAVFLWPAPPPPAIGATTCCHDSVTAAPRRTPLLDAAGVASYCRWFAPPVLVRRSLLPCPRHRLQPCSAPAHADAC